MSPDENPFFPLIFDFEALTILLPEGETYDGSLGPLTDFDGNVVGTTIIVSGTLFGEVDLDPGRPNDPWHTVIVTETGRIESPPEDNAFSAVFIGAGDRLENAGTITGSHEFGTAVEIVGDSTHVDNSGSVGGSYVGIGATQQSNGSTTHNSGEVSGDWVGIRWLGDGWTLTNTGVIRGLGEVNPDLGWGVLSSGDDGFLHNENLISGKAFGVIVSGSNNTIRNDGVIEQTGAPLEFDTEAIAMSGQNNKLLNFGIIQSHVLSVLMEMDGSLLVNNGSILRATTGAAVQMDGGSARFVNRGIVDGDVQFGDGDDRYTGFAGVVDGQISLGGGADTAIGGSGGETILGGDGADDIRGRGGDDTLLGNSGRDTIRGDGGADLINGGKGEDTLTGGRGADMFQFGNLADDDVITDFQVGTDLLDLTIPGITEEAEALAAMTDTADGALLDLSVFGAQGSVLLSGVFVADLDDPFLV